MSRQEAAAIYLDRLLGFREEYQKFIEAVETLGGRDRLVIEEAVSGR